MAPDIVARFNAAFREILGEAQVRELLAKHGVTPRLSTPQELDRLNREDYAALARLVKDAKIKGD
jgi:tripartite-type tricarboxylate transporter receptor subunit TctC